MSHARNIFESRSEPPDPYRDVVKSLFLDVWHSVRRLPVAVQLWLLVLGPVNLAALAFTSNPQGGWIAALALGGIVFNLPLAVRERGMSRLLALPHIIFWTPMIVLAIIVLAREAELSSGYQTFLWILIVTDLISLVFDFSDFRRWLDGDRAVV